jgi:protoporphyrinogen oxidase
VQSKPDRPLGILGGGASGLSLALLAHTDYTIIEKEHRCGGHAGSVCVDGWVFDHGPHIMFSRDRLVLDCMVSSLGSNVHRNRRNNKVAVAGAIAGYPLENDLAALPLPLRSEAVISMMRAKETQRPAANLAEWFEAKFGEVLVDTYFRPYNEKVWNVPLESLSMSWADRIPQPPMEAVIRGALGEHSDGNLHQLFYYYPARGGYSAIMNAWASGIASGDLVLGAEVTRVVPASDRVTVETPQREWRFEQVVSTIPLQRMVDIVPGVPAAVAAAVSRLVVNPMIIATFGFAGDDPNQFTAVYIPDADYLVNRVSYPAVFSPHNAPPGHFSVQAEITCPPGADVLGWTDEALYDHMLDGLRERSLVPAGSEPVFRWLERVEHGYVVYTNDYEDDVELAEDWFASRGIIIHGRFGRHQYFNIDACLRSSIDLARRLGAELTDDHILTRFKGLATD